jgi:predicted transcriptional regulator of viral defense system
MHISKRANGLIRTSEAVEAGVQSRTLAELVDAGALKKLSRGLYRLSDLPPVTDPDLVTIAMRIPHGIVTLVSALVFHELTLEVPRQIHLAIKAGSEKPRLDYPPIKLFWFSDKAYSEGIETHKIDGVVVQVYSVEKSIADCFKFRNKIGINIAAQAIRAWAPKNRRNWDKLLYYAKICRVEKIVKQYLEALA